MPVSVAELVLSQAEQTLRTRLFGALRGQPAAGHCHGERPEPERYWLSTLQLETRCSA